jgi:hypothetical protein
MSRRFQSTYGHFGAAEDAASVSAAIDTVATAASDAKVTKGFQLTPEAQEGLVSMLAVGTKLTQKAIETAAAKKRAKAKPKSKKKKAAAPTAAAVAVAAPTESTGISTQTLATAAGAFLLVGGLAWYASRSKASGDRTGGA